MNKKSNELYISDVTESEKDSRKYGDAQILIAGDEEKDKSYEKSGNQEKEYYKCEQEKVVEEKKVGNQSKEYYD